MPFCLGYPAAASITCCGPQCSPTAHLDRSREEEARGKAALATTLRSIGDAVIATDTDGRIRFINAMAEELTGWGASEAERRPLSEVFRVLDESTRAAPGDLAARVLAEGQSTAAGMLIAAGGGRETPIEYGSAPVLDEHGAVAGVVLVFRDITGRRKLEDDSARAEDGGGGPAGRRHRPRLQQPAHRHPELLRPHARRGPPSGDPIRGDVEQIRQAGQRAAGLTRQLLAFSRRQVLQPKVLSLNSVLADLDGMLRRLAGADVVVETETDPGLWYVLADPGQLEQVVINLVVNARDAMPDGGRIAVTTANRILLPDTLDRPAGVRPGAYVALALSDTGVGMDPELQSRIFEPFFTTKEPGKGTGLGLSTVYGIVQQSGGHVAVESAPGKGARFDMFLPAASATSAVAPAPEPAPASAPVQLAGGTVLVVEDDDSVRTLINSMLKSLGYRVLSPPSPEQALAVCADHAIDIDLLVTDIVLPLTDGHAVAREAKTLRPGLKVLLISGYTEHPVLLKNGDHDGAFLRKPFTKAALAIKLREVLAQV